MAYRLFDCNCEAGPYAFREYPVTTVAEVVGELRRHGINGAFVGSAAAITYPCPQPANERLMAEIQALAAGDFDLRAAAVLNPEYPGVARDLQACAALGFRALKLYPTYHGFDLRAHATAQLVDAATERGWPILLAVRAEDERHHHPLMKVPALAMDQAIAFARNLRRATIVLCTATNAEIVAFLQGVERESVLAETSYVKGPLNALEELVGKLGHERLLFGTHLPFSYAQTAVAKVAEAPLSEAAKAAILGGNAERVCGSA